MGFFDESALQERKDSTPSLPLCSKCGLYKTCLSPKMPVTGKGREKVLVVAEAPGKNEDEQGVQLVGQAGQRLRKALSIFGWNLDKDCWKTNACCCRPIDNKMADKYVECCRPTLLNTIEELKPEVILLLGAYAVKSLMGHFWGGDIGQLSRWCGWKIPLQPINTWVVSTYHPSFLLRVPNPVNDLWFERHLQTALECSGRPWSKIPKWIDDVNVLMSPRAAAMDIRQSMVRWSDCPASFDYETDRIKPDSRDSKILSCSICFDGRHIIAYPWTDETAEATSEFLRSSIPKYGANAKFEERWTRAILRHGVNAWKWDSVLAAHVLDNRPAITSVKFQAFVRLGLPLWDRAVEPYMAAEGGNGKNSLSECPIEDLLLYNGIDSLVEYKLAEVQMEEMENASA